MVVMVMDNASEKLRGTLTRWLLEVKPGVFVGTVNALVREKLWEKVKNDSGHAGAVLIFSSDSEQGFSMDLIGSPKRKVVDVEGIQLISVTE